MKKNDYRMVQRCLKPEAKISYLRDVLSVKVKHQGFYMEHKWMHMQMGTSFTCPKLSSTAWCVEKGSNFHCQLQTRYGGT